MNDTEEGSKWVQHSFKVLFMYLPEKVQRR